MKYRKFASVLILTSASLAFGQMVSSHGPAVASSHATAGSIPTEKPAVRVNGTVLTDRDVMREMYAMFPYARQHKGGFPKAMEPEIRKGAMQMIEFEELAYQETKRRGMSVPPQRLERALAQFRKQFQSEAEYQNVLKQSYNGSAAALKREIERSMLIETLLKAEVESKSVVTLAEARAYFQQNPTQFLVPESIAFQSISIMPPDNASAEQLKEARRRAEEALKQAKATNSYEQFGLLAEKVSEDNYRVNMGDHHAVPCTNLPREIVQTATKMKPGEVSELIQMGNAYSLFRLNAHTMARKRTFTEVEKPLLQYLRRHKTEQLRADLDKSLRKNAKIEEL